jgi:ABC-type transport system involved in multi-copper enzyme maturation permease subunit
MSAMPGVVAINTFREAVRDRVLYNLIFFALLMIGAAILVGQISIGIDRMVIINLGLTAISLIGLVMAIFIGVGLVSKEIEKRTLYSLLARPVHRWEFLVGKYAGLLLTLLVNTIFMTLGVAAALYYVGRPFVRADVSVLVAIYFILLELALVTALAMLFSCYSSPMLSTLFTVGVYITGVFAQDIRNAGDLSRSHAVEIVTRVIYYLVPNFHNFNVIAAVAHGESIGFGIVLQNTIYTVIYVVIVLLGATAIFSGRDLK